jgi:hypothetical protein
VRLRVGGRGLVSLVERRADGVPDARSVSTARGGRVLGLRLAGSGLGDALAGWQQGTDAFAQIGAAAIDAPPQEFAVQTPADFVRGPRRLELRWDAARNAIGGVRYAVTLDDEEVAANLDRRRHTLDLARLDDGVVGVQVIARDAQGQETSSAATTLKLDRRAPRVTVRPRSGRRVRVEVRDGPRGRVAGVDYEGLAIRWGDGRSAPGREGAFAVTHTYRRPGRYRVTVRAADLAGNATTASRTVRVR